MHKPDLDGARATARKVQGSRSYRYFVRGGLVAFGMVHLLIGYLALRLVIGEPPENPSETGALRELAKAPMGALVLWAVSIGFFAIALWQLLTAFVGHKQLEAALRTRRRWVSLGRSALYSVLGWNALTVALGVNDGHGTDTATAWLFSLPFGSILLVVVVVGVVGILFLWAAWTLDPEQAGGLDVALQAVRAAKPFGAVSLAIIAVGFGCYGVYCFAWARHARFT